MAVAKRGVSMRWQGNANHDKATAKRVVAFQRRSFAKQGNGTALMGKAQRRHSMDVSSHEKNRNGIDLHGSAKAQLGMAQQWR